MLTMLRTKFFIPSYDTGETECNKIMEEMLTKH